MRILLILPLLFGPHCLAAEHSERPTLVFAGYANFPSGRVFVVYDPATEESSPWMSLSQAWHGYAFVTFEQKREKLTLRKDAKELTLDLKPSKVVEALFRPKLNKGTYTVVNERIVYSADAELEIGNGIVISADDGVMTADLTQTTVSGNFRVMRGGSPTMVMHEAVLDLGGGKMDLRAKSVTVRPISHEFPSPPP